MLDKQTKELLPQIIQDAMVALEKTTNATDEITLPVTLAAATFATQGLANANPLQWKECAISNYFCILTPSGGLKTHLLDSVLEGARRFEQDQRQTAEDADTQYKIDMKKYENEIKDRSKETVAQVSTPFNRIVKPKFPRTARYLASKFTLNGIINALQGVPHIGVFNSDAGEFFKSHAFQDPTKSIELVSALSKLWSGEQLDKLTGIEDVVTAGKRTTALFMLQQQLADFFVNPQFKDQGFTNRILITQSEKISKKRADFSDTGLSQQTTTIDDLQPFNDRVYELLEQVDQLQSQPRSRSILDLRKNLQDSTQRDQNTLVLDKHPICMVDNTRKIFELFYNDMLDKMDDPKYSEYENFISRAYEHCVRLATVLSLFDKRKEVNERDAECASGLMYYFIDQRMNLNIDGNIRIDPIVECADALKKHMEKFSVDHSFSKHELNNSGPNAYRKMKVPDRDQVLAELASRDVIDIEQVDSKNGKKLTKVRLKV